MDFTRNGLFLYFIIDRLAVDTDSIILTFKSFIFEPDNLVFSLNVIKLDQKGK